MTANKKHKSPLYVVTEVTAPDGIHARRRSTTSAFDQVQFTVCGAGKLIHITVTPTSHDTRVYMRSVNLPWRDFAKDKFFALNEQQFGPFSFEPLGAPNE